MNELERNPSPSSFGMTSERSALRWRKDTALWRSVSEITKVDIDLDAYIEGNLSTQTSLIILDTLEVIVQVITIYSSYLLLHILKIY